jgi:hypothetical protein
MSCYAHRRQLLRAFGGDSRLFTSSALPPLDLALSVYEVQLSRSISCIVNHSSSKEEEDLHLVTRSYVQ